MFLVPGHCTPTCKYGLLTIFCKFCSPYGYPDPNYLQNVTKELAARGVTEASMTDKEKQDVQKVQDRLKMIKRYTDF